MSDSDYVVLVDDEGAPIGTAPKAHVHGADTALHLAFSCHVLNPDGEVLVTRRALEKATWPGVWTNSFCGHPKPAEPVLSAVHRRAEFELGLTLTDVRLELPLFRYRATDARGMVENELCPVYIAVTETTPAAHPGEVIDFAWVDPQTLGHAVRSAPWAFSPWLVMQARLLPFLGGEAISLDNGQHSTEAVDAA
ncbi:isopentenyl-diphosphate Delta-isomerase [Diaminobutyricimonas sp. LJ205]|uniref:isopentenyl-diphosphate Delta-isomerase n=1 Tax=Diaminobutyricimonas sp. LJ205 TaxID=2683590 RepID=UPI0012F491BA|nr:isopentenyl-diphosphate Delta-isomerase [Diaminobutyricimonas sp. LJ205]